ncbi:amidohydrolase family protein [Gammaproteobacteria bacterium]|nr:amidohydrolase family protein [Gammaproteobacteria bacterium]
MQNVDKIISAKWVLSTKNDSLLKDHSIVIEGNIIKDILPSKEISKKYHTNNHLVLKNHMLTPGLINNNTCLPHIFSRKYSKNNIPNTQKNINNKLYLELSAEIALCQMIKNGITTFTDTSTYPEVILKKVIKSGMRANIGLPILSCKTNWAEKEQEYFKKSIGFYDEYRNNPSIKLYLNLNAIHMLSKSGFEKVSQIASELDIPVRMYLHENLDKLNAFKNKYKQRPIKFLEELGLLSNLFTAMNPFHVTKSDINIMKKYRIHIVHTPSLNIMSKNIQCNTKIFLKNNIKVSLGTGEHTIGSGINLLNEMRLTSLLSRLNTNKNENLTQTESLQLITSNGAESLGLDFNIGKLKPKYSADLISIKINDLGINELDLYKYIENELISNNIDNVWISGKQILKDKKLLTINEDMLYHKFTELIKN